MKQANLIVVEIDQTLAEVAHCVMLGLDPENRSILHHASSEDEVSKIIENHSLDAAICKPGSKSTEKFKQLGIPVVEMADCGLSGSLGDITEAIYSALRNSQDFKSSSDSSI